MPSSFLVVGGALLVAWVLVMGLALVSVLLLARQSALGGKYSAGPAGLVARERSVNVG